MLLLLDFECACFPRFQQCNGWLAIEVSLIAAKGVLVVISNQLQIACLLQEEVVRVVVGNKV